MAARNRAWVNEYKTLMRENSGVEPNNGGREHSQLHVMETVDDYDSAFALGRESYKAGKPRLGYGRLKSKKQQQGFRAGYNWQKRRDPSQTKKGKNEGNSAF